MSAVLERRKYLSVVIEALCCSEAGKHDPIVLEHVFKKSYSRLLQVVQHVEVGGYKIKAGNVNERFFFLYFVNVESWRVTHMHPYAVSSVPPRPFQIIPLVNRSCSA